MSVSDEVAALLAPPGQSRADPRELGERCRPDDWPPLLAALMDPAARIETSRRLLATEWRLPGPDERFALIGLLAVVPAGWAVTALTRHVGAGRPGWDAMRALADHRHVLALRALREHTDHPDPEVSGWARLLVDQKLAILIDGHRPFRTPTHGARAHPPEAVDVAVLERHRMSALIALGAWPLLLRMLRERRGDAADRAGAAELPDGAVTGPGGATTLRRIRRAALRPEPAERDPAGSGTAPAPPRR